MTPLRLEPIRAMMYDRDHDLAAVTCPPYDAVTSSDTTAYEARHEHNAIRLIQPRGNSSDRHAHASQTLQEWRSAGVLRTVDKPALYVYSQVTGSDMALGLIGGIGLDGPILPHETTFSTPIADRVALMNATRAQLEPILLTYDGDGSASDIVDATTSLAPMLDATMDDGSRHRVWRIDEAAAIAEIRSDIAKREALIADGHHRFAAYQQLRQETTAPGTDDLGLALLVDSKRHPLRLRAMHRSVRGLGFDDALMFAAKGMHVERLHRDADPVAALHYEPPASAGVIIVVTDGHQAARLSVRSTDMLARVLPRDRPALWRSLDSAVVKHLLLGHLWGVDDADRRVGYHHRVSDAMSVAEPLDDAVAVLLRPPALSDVLTLARAGERMPQKSTSFGPKPRTGIVMRPLG